MDESAQMLAHVREAEAIHERIEDLDLGRRFDAVVLASNLVNAEPPQSRAFLETCRRLADLAIVQGLPLGWSPHDGETALGGVRSRLHVERIEDGVVHGEMEYEAGGETWRHPFAMRVLADDAELEAALAEAGLRFDQRLDDAWFTARSARAPS